MLPSSGCRPQTVPMQYACLYTTGGHNLVTGETYDTVLQFGPSSLAWTEVGRMEQPRAHHAASLARVQDLQEYCPQGTE